MVWSPPKNSEFGLYPPPENKGPPPPEDVFDTFPIGCAYSRAFEYAVILPQRGRVDLSNAASDIKNKIGKEGNTPFYWGWWG